MEPKSPDSSSLETIVAPWPIASTLSSHLRAGDLISLARSSTGLRAVLHGFEKPLPIGPSQDSDVGILETPKRRIRHSLNIGFHDTLYWQRLKEEAHFVCSSPTHTRGDRCRACRLCSKPICEACIVRSSFQRGKENTFNNRVRYFCNRCWDKGNITKSRRFPLSSPGRDSEWYSSSNTVGDLCTCTLKDDGWLCLECKDRQNYEAATSESKTCHGEGCNQSIGTHYERRRTCLWCQKALPTPFGGASRHVWTQQIIDAKQRSIVALSADIEEYNRMRLTTMRMSRRQLRGDDAVEDDPEADKPQYVRHLDTINYEQYMGHGAAPSGQEVYDSKRGYWRYTGSFLLRMQHQCRKVSPKGDLTYIHAAASEHTRTNAEKLEESKVYDRLQDIEKRVHEEFSDRQKQKLRVVEDSKKHGIKSLPRVFASNLWRQGTSGGRKRVDEWHTLKTHILDALFTQKLDLLQARVKLWQNYSFWAEKAEFEIVLTIWGQDFNTLEQPILPQDMPEREVFAVHCENLDRGFSAGETQDYHDDDPEAKLLEEWHLADERMGDLAKSQESPMADEDEDEDDDLDGREIDQVSLWQVSGTDASSSKQGRPLMSNDKVPSYLEDMDAQLMGSLARHSPPRNRRMDEDVDITFEPVSEAAQGTQSNCDLPVGISLLDDDSDEDIGIARR